MHGSLFSWKSTAFKQISLWAKKILSLISKFEFTFSFFFCFLISYPKIFLETKIVELVKILPIRGCV